MSVIALREKTIKASILFHMVFNLFDLFEKRRGADGCRAE